MTIKNHLEQFSKEQLINQIIELSKKYKEVKTFYDFSINPDIDKAKGVAKKLIEKHIGTEIHSVLKLGEARKAISMFKKLNQNEIDIIDIMLLAVMRRKASK